MKTKISKSDIITQKTVELVIEKENKASLSGKVSARPSRSLVRMKSVKPLNLASLKKLRKWKKEEV